jgi:hypothetical protein
VPGDTGTLRRSASVENRNVECPGGKVERQGKPSQSRCGPVAEGRPGRHSFPICPTHPGDIDGSPDRLADAVERRDQIAGSQLARRDSQRYRSRPRKRSRSQPEGKSGRASHPMSLVPERIPRRSCPRAASNCATLSLRATLSDHLPRLANGNANRYFFRAS